MLCIVVQGLTPETQAQIWLEDGLMAGFQHPNITPVIAWVVSQDGMMRGLLMPRALHSLQHLVECGLVTTCSSAITCRTAGCCHVPQAWDYCALGHFFPERTSKLTPVGWGRRGQCGNLYDGFVLESMHLLSNGLAHKSD